MTDVSEISGPKYELAPRVVGKLSFHQWDFRFSREGQKWYASYCLHEKCIAAPQLVGMGSPALPRERCRVRPGG